MVIYQKEAEMTQLEDALNITDSGPKIQARTYFEEKADDDQTNQNRSLSLGRLLQKLSEKDIPGKEHIEEYLRDQHRRNCRPSTLRNSLNAIDAFLVFIKRAGKTHLEEITRSDRLAFVEHEQDRGLKASTVRTRLRSLNAFLRFAMEDGVVRPEVLSKRIIIKVPDELPRAIELDDVEKLLSVIDKIRDKAMLLVLLRTGMRIGELLSTRLQDVHLKERRIEIFEAHKNRVGRVVYLSDDAQDALSDWLKKTDHRTQFVFYGYGNNPLSYPAARMVFVKHLEKAGLSYKGYTLHCLRHTNASELLNAGIPLECLKELLGHSTVEMTRRYAKLTDKTREQEYFKAMSIIEKGENYGHYRIDLELQEIHEKKELLETHSEKLHVYP
jgi:integrase/recombinase XerD